LSILPDGGSKWKFCFDDRNTQYAWLLALNDVIVEECVREYNSRILIKEAGDHSGGFHRLYEEGVPGLFESTKGMLLGDKVETAAVVLDKSERMSRRLQDSESIEVVGIKTDTQSSVLIEHEIGRNPVKEVMSEVNILSTSSEVEKLGLTTEKLHQAFFVVNLSVVYVYLTAQSDSFIAIPWWQVLMVMNAITYYLCLSPNNEEKKVTVKQGTTKEDLDPKDSMASVSKSVIGTALLQSEEVPLSEIPMELAQKPTVVTSNSQHRTEQLSEDEMTAHLHERWAMSAPNCDLSGSWTLIADESFKAEYDTYLKHLGFNRITRGVACSLIARTTEITKQSKGGRELYLKGINPKGAWERVLVASGFPDFETHDEAKEGTDYTHMRTSIKTADAEDVDAEAWWEERGTVHRSWLRGGTKYGGGDFESLRYIEEGSGGNILVSQRKISMFWGTVHENEWATKFFPMQITGVRKYLPSKR
jgi:hypothetical protein